LQTAGKLVATEHDEQTMYVIVENKNGQISGRNLKLTKKPTEQQKSRTKTAKLT